MRQTHTPAHSIFLLKKFNSFQPLILFRVCPLHVPHEAKGRGALKNKMVLPGNGLITAPRDLGFRENSLTHCFLGYVSE